MSSCSLEDFKLAVETINVSFTMFTEVINQVSSKTHVLISNRTSLENESFKRFYSAQTDGCSVLETEIYFEKTLCMSV